MPQVMESHLWKTCFLEQPLQPQERMVRVQVRSIRATEDKVVLFPGSTGRSPLCCLESVMPVSGKGCSLPTTFKAGLMAKKSSRHYRNLSQWVYLPLAHAPLLA
jgi:hypothetical protein